jgi:hypothetical protein
VVADHVQGHVPAQGGTVPAMVFVMHRLGSR